MKLGIKYCGGCNPQYDRVGFVERLCKELKGVEFKYVKPDYIYDAVLVACGCKSCCANRDDITAKDGMVIASSTDDYPKVCSLLKEIIKNKNGQEVV